MSSKATRPNEPWAMRNAVDTGAGAPLWSILHHSAARGHPLRSRRAHGSTTAPSVIASEAKQSKAIQKRSTGLLRRRAPRNDGGGSVPGEGGGNPRRTV